MKAASSFILSAVMLLGQRAPTDPAWDLLMQGKRVEAVAVLRDLIRTNPANSDARLMIGSILAEDGKYAEAIPQLREGVRLSPQSPSAHNALGEALRDAGDIQSARAEFEKTLRLDETFAQAHVNLGRLLLETGESPAAASHLDRAIVLLGKQTDAAYPEYLRARIYTEQNQPAKAASLLRHAVSLQPEFAEAWSDLGQARKALLDDAGAFAAFQRSVELIPDNAVSQYRLGAEYLRQGKPGEAIRHLTEAVRLNPRNQSALYSLQLALRQNGRTEEATRMKQQLSELLRNIDRESQNAFAALRLNNEGASLEKSGNLQGALDRYRRAVALDPSHVGMRVNLGVALLRTGDWNAGLTELRQAVRQDPKSDRARTALDDALYQAPAEFRSKPEHQGSVR